jgi:signal transduction histidine kinase
MKANGNFKIPHRARSGGAAPIARHSKSEASSRFRTTDVPGGWMQSASMEMVLPQIKDGIVVCDAQGLIVLANPSAKQLAAQNLEGRPLRQCQEIWGELFDLDGSYIDVDNWPLAQALCGKNISYKEYRLVRSSDCAFDILFSASPIVDFERRIVGAVATLTDITPQKRNEDLKREQSLERERSRMATHIHDTVSQSLTAITLQLQAADRELHQNSHNAEICLQRAIDLARDTLADLRRCIWTLSHESLEGEDLAEALSFLADRLFTSTPVELKLSLQRETAALPREIRHEILWISKEALSNVLKHALATKVHIELLCGKKEVQLRVEDNGHGFEAIRPLHNGSFGLISMRKRAERLGGSVAVVSHLGRGTRVVAIVPCPLH